MMMPVPSPLSRRLEATMSTTDGSTLARIAFTSRAAPASGPTPEAGAVVDGVADGIGLVVAPPDGAVALVTAGESDPFDARLTPMAAPRLPATRARAATPPTSATVRLPATDRVPRSPPRGGEGWGNPDGPPHPGGAGGGAVGG